MTEIMMILAVAAICSALAYRAIEDRRAKRYEELKRKIRDRKLEVERQARKQL